MRDLSNEELGFVYGAGGKGRCGKPPKCGKGSKSRGSKSRSCKGSKSRGSRSHGHGSRCH